MAIFTIRTRDLGTIEFTCRADGGYVFADTNGKPGSLGQQICEGGGFLGSTLRATEATLPAVARRWNSDRRAAARAFGQ